MSEHILDDITPARLPITRRALKKAISYARIVAEEHPRNECIGFLLTDAERTETLVDDVLLAPDQRASSASVTIGGGAVLQAGREMQAMGKRGIGWWHS